MKAAALTLLALCSILPGQTVPRPAPELTVTANTKLSDFRGRIVVLAFISDECPHCQSVSRVMEQLSREFAGKLTAAEVAFNAGADVRKFAQRFGLTFPIGTATPDAVHAFLEIPRGLRLGTPQMVIIDQKGMIRAQSERLGTPLLQTPEFLRSLVRALSQAETVR